MKKLYIILALLMPLLSSAQVFTWNKVVDTIKGQLFNSSYFGEFSSITKKTADNSIVYVQNINKITSSNWQDKYDSITIAKYNYSGNIIWKKKYILENGGNINDFIETADNGFLLVGEIGIYNSIVKLDQNGNFVFAKNYINIDSMLILKNIVATNDGNYILYSYKKLDIFSDCNWPPNEKATYKTFISKINTTGDILWHNQLSEDKFNNLSYGFININYKIYPRIELDFWDSINNRFNILYYKKENFDDISSKLILMQFDKNGNRLDSNLLIENPNSNNPWFCTNDVLENNIKVTPDGYTLFITVQLDSTIIKSYYYNKNGALTDSAYNIYPYYSQPIFFNKLYQDFKIANYEILNNKIHYILNHAFSSGTQPYYNFIYTSGDLDYNNENNFNLNKISYLEDKLISIGYCTFVTAINDSLLLFVSEVQSNSLDSTKQLKFYHISLNSNRIDYQIYIDRNNNGTNDNNDTTISNCLVEINDGNTIQDISFNTVNYLSNKTIYTKYLPAGNYTSKLISYEQILRYYTISPLSKNTIFNTNFNGIDSVTFRLVPKPNIQDLQVNIIPITNARPGFNSYYKITAKNVGTKTTENISVEFIKNHLQNIDTTYYTQPYSISEDTIIWQIDSLRIFEEQAFYVVCNNATPPDLNIGDTLHLFAQIFPIENDSFIQDNIATLHQPVVNAVDPNDKIETHGGTISYNDIQQQEYLYYTIRFQNTGNSYASRVVITDTLTDNLNPNTLEMLSFSHTFTYNIIDRKYITWTANLYLPDSTTNEIESHGYISFRIKPKANLSRTDVIINRASIIFDYNEAITTNTCTTNIIEERISGIQQNNIKSIKLFPSPTSGNVQLSFDASLHQKLTIKIMNVQGNIMYQQEINNQLGTNNIELQLSEFANGIYFIQLNSENKELYYGKVLKQ